MEKTTLRQYLTQKQLEIKEFAEMIGYSRTYISLVCNGKVNPSGHLKKTIEILTQGQVMIFPIPSINRSPQPRKKICDLCGKDYVTCYASRKYCLDCKTNIQKKPSKNG